MALFGHLGILFVKDSFFSFCPISNSGMWTEKVISVDDKEVGVIVAHVSGIEICDREHVRDHTSVSLGCIL